MLQRAGTERSPRSGQYDFLYRIADFSCQTLKNSGMFGVHRQNRCTVLLCQFINQFSRHDQRFLIRQCNGFLCPNRIHGRFQSGVADHRRQYHINRPGLHYLADGVSSRVYLYRQVAQSFFQFGQNLLDKHNGVISYPTVDPAGDIFFCGDRFSLQQKMIGGTL